MDAKRCRFMRLWLWGLARGEFLVVHGVIFCLFVGADHYDATSGTGTGFLVNFDVTPYRLLHPLFSCAVLETNRFGSN